MLINHEFVKTGRKVTVHDCEGRVIGHLVSYDTETQEVEFVWHQGVEFGQDNKPSAALIKEMGKDGKATIKTVKTVLLGSYAVVDGKRI